MVRSRAVVDINAGFVRLSVFAMPVSTGDVLVFAHFASGGRHLIPSFYDVFLVCFRYSIATE